MTHAIQIGDSILPVIEELVEQDLVLALMGDNAAAVASFGPGAGTWRNRHLRMRAQAARERIDAGTLQVGFLPGDIQVADIGTKPLSGGRMLGLLALVNVRELLQHGFLEGLAA